MAVAQHIVERVSHLRAAQTQWEGVRQQVSAKLLEPANPEPAAGTEPGFYVDNEREQLRSQLSSALFHMQEIGQELTQIREQLEADAREQAANDPELDRPELLRREDAQKEQFTKEAADKLEALRKEESLKDAAIDKEQLDKEQRDKEFFEKKDAERLEAATKEERDKPEALASQQSDLELVASINEEWQYVLDEIQSEWDYIDQEIQKEMVYNVGQALDAVSEAGFEIGKAFANSISQKEGKQFLETQRQALGHFVADEVFDAAPARHKEMWLEHKFKEQLQTEQATFGHRNDDNNIRTVVQEGLAEMHDTLRKAVKQELALETEVNAKAKARDEMYDETKARLEKSGSPPAVIEEQIKKLDEIAKQQEQQERDSAEKERQAKWAEAAVVLNAIEAEKGRQAEMLQEEQRKEAERARQDFFRDF